MSANRKLMVLAGLAAFNLNAHAFDPLGAEQNISATAGGAIVPVCEFSGPPARPLGLAEAVERTLCNNPKTRAAWAMVKAQAAGVGTARAAYLPTISANWQGVRESSVVDIENHPALSEDINAFTRTAGVSLNWLLYDFGGREAALRNANALLDAARATQDATLQDFFAQAAKDYYATQTAIGELEAAQDVEALTRQSMTAAKARVDKGVAPITDALQAQTQHEQAVFSLTKAESDAQTALGTLAADMNLTPDVPMEVPGVTEGAQTDHTFSDPVAEMIRDVQATHPSVRAAQAQYEAALAKVSQTRAQGLPGISLVAKYSRNNQPQSMGLGLATYSSTGHDAYIGVQVSIPLFEGFGRNYQIDQAKAQAERQEDAIADAQRQVALDVWSSYQTLTGATKNAQNSANLLTIAQRSWVAAKQRYDAGVGNILELMNTQGALANAKQRRVQALADWDNARVDLASKLGILGRDDVR
ncbi:outer membrane protein [Paraburkholderia sp. BL6669N2]|uniref:TolC family protein n=1 Tax=Paraburkholderia sp. BL6669N2 TaxID=1938807 RepID=UPI000E383152|nr:TolC family protein [Paraburkholderia sp. BL6669N2]REG58062.1 outer membrane protein [Paraburkholderia sp. BL6669N2]